MIDQVIVAAASRIQAIENGEIRTALAYMLDEFHGWRCGVFADMDECNAVAMSFPEENNRMTALLQPVLELSSWYVQTPFRRVASQFKRWNEDFDDDGWVSFREGLVVALDVARNPKPFLPRFREAHGWIARFAAENTWYSADGFIASYVAHAAPKLSDDLHGMPMFFVDNDFDDETQLACIRYSLAVLAETARAVADDELDADPDEFADMLAEAIKIGMLWD